VFYLLSPVVDVTPTSSLLDPATNWYLARGHPALC